MRNNRFQNHVSESSITLPLCMVIGALVWFWNGDTNGFSYTIPSLVAFAMAVLTTYAIMETSNVFSILRIRSNMIAVVWVTLISFSIFTHTFYECWIAALAIAGSHYVMFLSYQQHEPIMHVFHAFLLVGVAVLAIPQLIILIPFYYWYLLIFLRCMTWRGFWAGLVGLTLPACFALGWSIFIDDYSFMSGRIEDLASTRLLQAEEYGWMLSYRNNNAIGFALVSLLSLVGIVHYLRNYYNDKIRTRMYLYIYVMQTMVCWLMIVCMPDMYQLLAPVLMVSASTMIAHFFALTGSLASNLFFCATIIAIIFLFIINLGIWTY